ncbi:hypothetical protein CHARACLAT_006277 [Characodon lateralis]|uniref:Uncharacterized protein n=1 Tax=Characodon lateralis TaxID=208331 RepID=A0ABU7E1D7_9TELE|nr:hypothetical protein [Characodon lateralis]
MCFCFQPPRVYSSHVAESKYKQSCGEEPQQGFIFTMLAWLQESWLPSAFLVRNQKQEEPKCTRNSAVQLDDEDVIRAVKTLQMFKQLQEQTGFLAVRVNRTNHPADD